MITESPSSKDNTAKPAGQADRGVIFDLKRFAIHDGPGIRTTVFFKGCAMRCQWCHNPESWREGIETAEIRHDDGDDGPWIEHRQVGRAVTAEALMAEIERDVLFFDRSGGGVTFSGGEPLVQVDFLETMLRLCCEREIHTAVDTTCHASWLQIERLLPYTRLFLADLKHLDPQVHRKYTGVSNELVLDNLQRLAGSGARVFIRIPIVPTVNDSPDHIEAMGRFLSGLGAVERVDLLPYHRLGASKAGRMSIIEQKFVFDQPTKEDMMKIASKMREHGLNVGIGG